MRSRSTPYELVTITPEALSWIGRELVPEPGQPMCGKTAGEYYDASFKTMVQSSALAWEHVRKSGKLRGLGLTGTRLRLLPPALALTLTLARLRSGRETRWRW